MSEARVPEILFVCVHNAGRSQMAAGLVNLRSGGRVDVRSAGSDPADEINPLTSPVMADVVVTLGCGDACPIYPGKRYEDWVVRDPAEAQSIEEVRAIRDEIDQRVQSLLDDLERRSG
jgi:arsenate reductase (thioredoxin)